MSSNLQQFQANAKVFIMMDDYPSNKLNNFDTLEHPKKTIYQITSFTDISTNFDVEAGGGSVTLTLNDKDKRFWKNYPIYQNLIRNFGTHEFSFSNNTNIEDTIKSVIYNDAEVITFQKLLDYYSTKDNSGVYKDLSKLAKDFTNEVKVTREAGGILAPSVAPQNMIWVFFLGRDGYWYSAFTGLIQTVKPNNDPKQTPTISVTARTFDRIFEYSYIVTGQLPIVPRKNVIQRSVAYQGGKNGYGTIAWVNRLADKRLNEIIKECIETCNLFFSRYMVNNESGKDNVNNRLGCQNIFDKVYKMEENSSQKEKTEKENNSNEPIEGDETVPETTVTEKKEEIKNETYDYRYFKVRKIFGFGRDLDSASDSPYWGGETIENGIDLSDTDAWTVKKYFWNDKIKPSDLYVGEELQDSDGKQINVDDNFSPDKPRDLFQVKISKDFIDSGSWVKAFQILVRTNINLFNVDKMSIKDVFDALKKCTLAYFYCDYDGSFKIERPYFDTWLENITDKINSDSPVSTITPFSYTSTEVKNADDGNPKYNNATPFQLYDIPPEIPADYDLKYVVSRKDISYLNDNYSESETNIVTRGFVESKFNYGILNGNTANPVIEGVQGVSESSYSTIAKYGDRQITFSPVVHENLKYLGRKDDGDALMNAYALANKLLINYKQRAITITFDQRPDIQLNRNMVFLDLGLMFLTTNISQQYDARTSTHRTIVTGSYTRPIGSLIYNPFFYTISKDNKSSFLKKWTMADLIIPKPNGTLIEGKQPPEYLKDFDAVGTYNYISSKYLQRTNDKVLCLCIRARNPNNVKEGSRWDYFKFVWKKDETKGVSEENLGFVEMMGYSGSGSTDYANKNNIKDGQSALYIKVNRNSSAYLDFSNDYVTIDGETFLQLKKEPNSQLIFGIDGSNDVLAVENIISNKVNNSDLPPILLGDSIIVPNYDGGNKILDKYSFSKDLQYNKEDGQSVNATMNTLYINTLNMYLGRPDNDRSEDWLNIYNAVQNKDKKGLFMMIIDSEYVIVKKDVNGDETANTKENPFDTDLEELAFVAGKMVRAWNHWSIKDDSTINANAIYPMPSNDIKWSNTSYWYPVYNSDVESELKRYYAHRQESFEKKIGLQKEEKIDDDTLSASYMGYRFGLSWIYDYGDTSFATGSTSVDKVKNFSSEFFKYKSKKPITVINNVLIPMVKNIYDVYYKGFINQVLKLNVDDNGELVIGDEQAVNNLTAYTFSENIMKHLIYVILLSTYNKVYANDNDRKKDVVYFINEGIVTLYIDVRKNGQRIYFVKNGEGNKLQFEINGETKKKSSIDSLNNTQNEALTEVFTTEMDTDFKKRFGLIGSILFFFKHTMADKKTFWTDADIY